MEYLLILGLTMLNTWVDYALTKRNQYIFHTFSGSRDSKKIYNVLVLLLIV